MAIVVTAVTALILTLALTAHAGDPGSAYACSGTAIGSESADCCPTVCEVTTELPEPPEFTEEEAANLASCYLECLFQVRALVFQRSLATTSVSFVVGIIIDT